MIITQTPLRVSLAGGGTDLPAYYRTTPGAVISSAIDKFVYVILNPRFDERIYVSYSQKEIVDSVDDIRHELVREAMRMTGVRQGVELAMMADIPSEGSGLGSSSSLTVGLLNALYAYRGLQAPAEQLAREACEIEIDRCGKPIGKQDQYIAAYGGLRFLQFRPDGRVDVEDVSAAVKRPELGARLMLFFTGITRKAESLLAEQTARTEENRSVLDRLRAMAHEVRAALEGGDYDSVGRALRESWALKKTLAGGISNAGIEAMVAQAEAGGATGCKICGAGGGGFLLTHCPPGERVRLRRSMADHREMPFFLERFGSRIVFNVEGYEWK